MEWPSDDPLASDFGWPITGKIFLRLTLAISPRHEEEDKEKKDVDDGWGPPPDVTPDPADVWGKILDDRCCKKCLKHYRLKLALEQ